MCTSQDKMEGKTEKFTITSLKISVFRIIITTVKIKPIFALSIFDSSLYETFLEILIWMNGKFFFLENVPLKKISVKNQLKFFPVISF